METLGSNLSHGNPLEGDLDDRHHQKSIKKKMKKYDINIQTTGFPQQPSQPQTHYSKLGKMGSMTKPKPVCAKR